MRLKRPFFLRPPEVVAQELLGKSLYFNGIRVIIVETESYGVNDPACHSFKGKTLRNEPMFKEGGRSYVYFIYGMHYCFNVVTEKEDVPSAVLIRGGIPVTRLEEIQKRREKRESAEKIMIGPGNFCKGMGIGPEQNDVDLCRTDNFYFYSGDLKGFPIQIGVSPRIGISRGKEKLWRFFLKDLNLNKLALTKKGNFKL